MVKLYVMATRYLIRVLSSLFKRIMTVKRTLNLAFEHIQPLMKIVLY